MSSLKIDQDRRARGRPRGFDEDAALEAAMLTFWERGYRATSIDDLVARTGASRASLYKTFGDKRDIFLKSVDLYGTRFEARAAAVLAEGRSMGETARVLLTASAERLASSDAPAGCLRCNSTLELMGSDAAIDAALDDANRRYLQIMAAVVDRGVAAGEVDAARRDALALFLAGTVAGMVTLARSGADRAALLSIVEVALERFPDDRTRSADEKSLQIHGDQQCDPT